MSDVTTMTDDKLPPSTGVADIKHDRWTLKDLRGVQVLIEELNAEAVQAGLRKAMLATDVELRLRQVGITVVSKGDPTLYVRVGVQASQWGPYFYTVRVELFQTVTLKRDPTITTFGSTWHARGVFGTVPPSGAPSEAIKGSVRDKVDEFINAYLAVNPKR